MNQQPLKSNRAVIINPPIQDFYSTPHRMSALGIKIVDRIVQNAGFETRYIDGAAPGSTREMPLPRGISYLKPFILPNETGKCTFFTRFRHFGKPYDKIVDEVAAHDPDLCFIGCFAFCYGRPTIDLSGLIRERCPRTIIIAGGAGISVYPDYFLRYGSIDYTLGGEAEVTLLPFLNFVRNQFFSPEQIPHLGWKKGAERYFSTTCAITSESTLQPIIGQTGFDHRPTAYTASLSRGCPASCRFCSNHLSHGRRFRHCSIEHFKSIIAEIPHQTGDPVGINFEDDNLLHDYPFFMQVIEQCKQALPGIRFTAENGLDYRLLSPEQCEALIDAGFSQFNFTLGSTSSTVLDRTDRDSNLQRFDDLLSIAKRRGIPVVSYVICGFPDDTKSSIAENLRFLKVRTTTIGVSLFYPVPGIAGFENPANFDRLPLQRCAGASAYPWGRNCATATLITAFRLARFINLTKSPQHTAEDSALISRTMQTGKIHTIIKEQGKRRIIEVPLQDVELSRMVLE